MDKQAVAKLAYTFLKSKRLCAFATVSLEQKPHVSYMYYLVLDSLHLAIATENHSRKLANIKANKHVALVIGQEEEPKTLYMEGIAEVVTNLDERQALIQKYAVVANNNHSTNLPPLLYLSKDSNMEFISITITAFKYSDFSEVQKVIGEGTPADWQ